MMNSLKSQSIKQSLNHLMRRWRKKWATKPDKSQLTALTYTKKTYILPTLKGGYFLLTIIIMFLWSTNYELSLGYIFTFFSLCFFLMSAILSVANLVNLRITFQYTGECFVKKTADYNLLIENLKKEPVIDVQLGETSDLNQNDNITLPYLKTRDKRNVQILFKKQQRGVFSTSLIKVQSKYPMGLFRAWAWLDFSTEQIVYPEIKGNLNFPNQQAINHNHYQNRKIHKQGGDEFNELKEYQEGDNIKRIFWKKSVNNNWVVKQFNTSNKPHYIFDLESSSLNNLSLEDKLSQLCVWIIEANNLKLKYALKLPNQWIDINTGEIHKKKCLRALACY